MRRFIKSLGYAFAGVYFTFRSERNFRIQSVVLCLTVALGLYLGLSALEWGIIALSSGFVLSAELFNTAVERLGDEVAGGKQNKLIRNAKDISAGAVFFAALTAFIIGILILIVPFFRRIL